MKIERIASDDHHKPSNRETLNTAIETLNFRISKLSHTLDAFFDLVNDIGDDERKILGDRLYRAIEGDDTIHIASGIAGLIYWVQSNPNISYIEGVLVTVGAGAISYASGNIISRQLAKFNVFMDKYARKYNSNKIEHE